MTLFLQFPFIVLSLFSLLPPLLSIHYQPFLSFLSFISPTAALRFKTTPNQGSSSRLSRGRFQNCPIPVDCSHNMHHVTLCPIVQPSEVFLLTPPLKTSLVSLVSSKWGSNHHYTPISAPYDRWSCSSLNVSTLSSKYSPRLTRTASTLRHSSNQKE